MMLRPRPRIAGQVRAYAAMGLKPGDPPYQRAKDETTPRELRRGAKKAMIELARRKAALAKGDRDARDA